MDTETTGRSGTGAALIVTNDAGRVLLHRARSVAGHTPRLTVPWSRLTPGESLPDHAAVRLLLDLAVPGTDPGALVPLFELTDIEGLDSLTVFAVATRTAPPTFSVAGSEATAFVHPRLTGALGCSPIAAAVLTAYTADLPQWDAVRGIDAPAEEAEAVDVDDIAFSFEEQQRPDAPTAPAAGRGDLVSLLTPDGRWEGGGGAPGGTGTRFAPLTDEEYREADTVEAARFAFEGPARPPRSPGRRGAPDLPGLLAGRPAWSGEPEATPVAGEGTRFAPAPGGEEWQEPDGEEEWFVFERPERSAPEVPGRPVDMLMGGQPGWVDDEVAVTAAAGEGMYYPPADDVDQGEEEDQGDGDVVYVFEEPERPARPAVRRVDVEALRAPQHRPSGEEKRLAVIAPAPPRRPDYRALLRPPIPKDFV